MDHLKRSHDFIDEISEVVALFQFEFNTQEVRLSMCHHLHQLFEIKFDDYWQSITGIHSSDFKFVDLTTNDMVDGLVEPDGRSTYQIGVSIRGSEPIPFSDFITEHFSIDAVRDRKIKEILA